jgi:hypothetical protein
MAQIGVGTFRELTPEARCLSWHFKDCCRLRFNNRRSGLTPSFSKLPVIRKSKVNLSVDSVPLRTGLKAARMESSATAFSRRIFDDLGG